MPKATAKKANNKRPATDEIAETEQVETGQREDIEEIAKETAAAPTPGKAAALISWGEDDPRFWRTALWLLLLGIALRQFALARAPYSSDEAIHAWFALGFLNYTYDPVYHGPLLYHLLAMAFTLIKPTAAGDYVPRLVPSLLGIGVLALIVGPARRWLGSKGALWSLALLAISPVVVAYHRVIIHDALVMLLTLGAILCFQRSLETHSWTVSGRQARIGVAVLLTLFIATKANAFFIIAMLLAFWVAAMLVRAFGPLPPKDRPSRRLEAGLPLFLLARRLETLLPLFLFALVAVNSHFALRDPDLQPYLDGLKAQGVSDTMLHWARLTHSEATFKIVCVASAGLLFLWLLVAPAVPPVEAPTAEENIRRPRFDLRTLVIAGWLSTFLFFYLYGHGAHWWKAPVELVKHPTVWLERFDNSVSAIGATMRQQKDFLVPPEKDWTATQLVEAPDWDAAISAIPRMISYWGGQQKKPRLPGPHDYYVVLMILYELPIALAAIGGIWHASRRRTPFGDLLLWWAFTSVVLYAVANEKVPWLMAHLVFPLALLAGMWLGNTQWRGAKLKVLYIASALGAVFMLRNVVATSFGRPSDQHEPLYYAQTTEHFHDTYVKALLATSHKPGDVWLDPPTQWPAVWWLRAGAPLKGDANMAFNPEMPQTPLRVAIVTPETWEKYKGQMKDWEHEKLDYFVWSRASWPALRPKTFWNFWAHRVVNKRRTQHPETFWKLQGYLNANPQDLRRTLKDGTVIDDSLLAPPGEWSHSEAVIAWKK